MDRMAEILLFHHVYGRTDGVERFAGRLRQAGHVVHVPDLYEGQVFDSMADGQAYARSVGFGELLERGVRAADDLPADLVYAGLSLGVVPAQRLAQTRPGARGALLLYSCLPVAEFGSWPAGVPVQVHGMDGDELFAGEGDLDAARELVATTPDAELFVYPGKQHLFADDRLPDHDPKAAELLLERVVSALARW
jgi:dienelactone hydrolase